jgi:hypothetical protein
MAFRSSVTPSVQREKRGGSLQMNVTYQGSLTCTFSNLEEIALKNGGCFFISGSRGSVRETPENTVLPERVKNLTSQRKSTVTVPPSAPFLSELMQNLAQEKAHSSLVVELP